MVPAVRETCSHPVLERVMSLNGVPCAGMSCNTCLPCNMSCIVHQPCAWELIVTASRPVLAHSLHWRLALCWHVLQRLCALCQGQFLNLRSLCLHLLQCLCAPVLACPATASHRGRISGGQIVFILLCAAWSHKLPLPRADMSCNSLRHAGDHSQGPRLSQHTCVAGCPVTPWWLV